MESDDTPAELSAFSPINERENDIVDNSAFDTSMDDPQHVEAEEVKTHTDIIQSSAGTTNEDGLLSPSTDVGSFMANNLTVEKVSFQPVESSEVTKVITEEAMFSHTVHTENGCATVQDISVYKTEVLGSSQETRFSTLSGSKRPRESFEEEASVQIIYKSLTGDSRKKLQELLLQWSQWHAKHCSTGNDSEEDLESGEEMYFPAVQVGAGADKTSAVSFCLDTDTGKRRKKDIISFDGNSVPVYDRGFSLALTSMDDSNNPEGVMLISESRCFNCGSFNHALKDCTKPRDNVAVNNARKQHNSKRNQTPGSRSSSRYYQDSVGGKYDGLKPGSLDSETRKALGLGMFDPPPWLNRMREIGYPPGYMDEDEDGPSGITIFDDEEKEKEKDKKEEEEEGEISLNIPPEVPKKKSVEFPGVNAPIPEWADENRWRTPAGNADVMFRDERSYGSNNNNSRYNNRSSDNIGRGGGYHHEQRWPRDSGEHESRGGSRHQEQRWPRDSRDEDDDEPPPPGCASPMSSHSRGYGGDSGGYNSNISREPWTSRFERNLREQPWSSSFERSLSDRSRRNPLDDTSSPSYRSYGSHLSSSAPR